MSKRFESKAWAAGQFPFGGRVPSPEAREASATMALHEAERILSETERAVSDLACYDLTLATPGVTIYPEFAALADRLAAVLPVLDDLAADAYEGLAESDWTEQASATFYRNRAALDAMVAHSDGCRRDKSNICDTNCRPLDAMGGAQ